MYSKLRGNSHLNVRKHKNKVTNKSDVLLSVAISYASGDYDLIILKPNKENTHSDLECWLIQDTFGLFDLGGWFKWLCKGRKSFSRLELILKESIGLTRK